jgi:hypothetical protein
LQTWSKTTATSFSVCELALQSVCGQHVEYFVEQYQPLYCHHGE